MKNKTQHAPGPWILSDTEEPGNARIRSKDEDNTVAEVWCNEMAGNDISESEFIANARLIAAAPELLAALEGIQNSMKDFKGIVEWSRSEVAEKAFYTARAAIAKAKGE